MKTNTDHHNVNHSAEDTKGDKVRDKVNHQPHNLNIPRFITDEDIGLGDVVKRVTYALGIKPCGGCQRRAAALNRWLVFSPRSKK